jgi:heme/copper-type cytochrome/quinol oxidase subunit 2
VTLARRHLSLDALQWYGVFGAPVAWGAQFLVGFSFHIAQCNAAGRSWALSVHAWTIATTAVAAILGLLALAAAGAVFREVSRRGEEEVPHGERLKFLSILGLAITPLFLCIILMSGFGTTLIDSCRQS